MTEAPGEPQASGPSAFLPSRRLPLLYLGFAHVSLALAFAVAAIAPARVSGFFYQPRTFAFVHLVTLGWISASILGSLYIVAPLALRLSLPASRLDYAAFASFSVGTLGMASHFWIDRPVGMLWAAPLPFLAFLRVAIRIFRGLPKAPLPRAVAVHVVLAFANVLLAAALGFFLGLNKVASLLPVPPFAGVVAHAHLAAVGFAAMMVMGAGYRLIPMFLPAAMPSGGSSYASAALTEVGLVGLVAGALTTGRISVVAAALVAAGLLAFLSRVGWMLFHRRPAPRELRRPDWGMAQVGLSFVCLVGAIGIGCVLAVAEGSEASLQWAKVYGVLGLVGFLAQIVVGVESRLLPMVAWLWSFAEGGHKDLPLSLHETPSRPIEAARFGLWTIGVPLLAWGAFHESERATSAAGALLLVATLANAANLVVMLRRSAQRFPPPSRS